MEKKKDIFGRSLHPPVDPTSRIGGRFVFLGSAHEGEPAFDAPPPRGVVKCFSNTTGKDGEKIHEGTAGFFVCARVHFSAFKKAMSAWNGFASWGYYDTIGTYPLARVIIVPYVHDEDRHQSLITSAADVKGYAQKASRVRQRDHSIVHRVCAVFSRRSQ